jgi:hypothetical protein
MFTKNNIKIEVIMVEVRRLCIYQKQTTRFRQHLISTKDLKYLNTK